MTSCSSAFEIPSRARSLTFQRSVCQRHPWQHQAQVCRTALAAAFHRSATACRSFCFVSRLSDLRNAVPRYRVWRDGIMAKECQSVEDVWAETGDMICFLLGRSTRQHTASRTLPFRRLKLVWWVFYCMDANAGCSFSWEDKLAQAGLVPRHAEMGCNVPMYRCANACVPPL